MQATPAAHSLEQFRRAAYQTLGPRKDSLFELLEAALVSPGPCTPHEAGISIELIRHFTGKVPVLGVCLGHQAIGEAFGGRVVRAVNLMHGKTSAVMHDNKTVFQGLPMPMTATRYHSLIVEEEDLPAELEVSA